MVATPDCRRAVPVEVVEIGVRSGTLRDAVGVVERDRLLEPSGGSFVLDRATCAKGGRKRSTFDEATGEDRVALVARQPGVRPLIADTARRRHVVMPVKAVRLHRKARDVVPGVVVRRDPALGIRGEAGEI